MTDTITEPKGVEFTEVKGTLPAWLWKGIREAERKTGDRYFPATVVRDGNSSLVIVDASQWNEIVNSEREKPS